jgi:hypothetical protein
VVKEEYCKTGIHLFILQFLPLKLSIHFRNLGLQRHKNPYSSPSSNTYTFIYISPFKHSGKSGTEGRT